MTQSERNVELIKIVKANLTLFPMGDAPKELLEEVRNLYKSEICNDAIISRLNNIFKKL